MKHLEGSNLTNELQIYHQTLKETLILAGLRLLPHGQKNYFLLLLVMLRSYLFISAIWTSLPVFQVDEFKNRSTEAENSSRYDAGLSLESFSTELVILAIWTEVLQFAVAGLASTPENEASGSSTANKPKLDQGGADLPPNTEGNLDFSRPSCVSMRVENHFLLLLIVLRSCQIISVVDCITEMPDAMEIIFRKALAFGTNGAVEEFENNKYFSREIFRIASPAFLIAGQAAMLSLNPPFS
ncbi:hypothetical protein TorRG33x02_345040 [Trema orientale]|uniref:ATG1a/b/c MIT domain-containing protein n=1 Tax=Trema orientale TaxID=63057 RepID=A0A2P5APK4_TREOI|nr:hypothetical protein TorRG33x02_345040 [Trema orientale]